jgi:hypothetical protein
VHERGEVIDAGNVTSDRDRDGVRREFCGVLWTTRVSRAMMASRAP